jgi:hypothetical protein
MSKFIGTMATVFCLLFTGLVTQVWAKMPPSGGGGGAPEIDPGLASGAIGLLACGLLILTARRKKK